MQKDRKKLHKKIIKYMRIINKQLYNDEYIGCGRFRIDLNYENWSRYSNGLGGYMCLIFTISDSLTGNKGFFICNNYDYKYKINNYLNDFLIRCSSGQYGHYPPLNYIAYDVHEIIPYNRIKDREVKAEDGVINFYDWIIR